MAATVTAVYGKQDREAFIRLPWRLYAGDPNWVPPLLMVQREQFSPKHNPFYQHADVRLFLARRDGQVVGRVSAQVDHEHNRYHGERTGFFGFFEAENDPEVARALLGAAEEWLREKGTERVRGPLSFSINGEVGLLVDGFDSPPLLMMPYSPPHYMQLLEGCGYRKAKDLFAWRYEGNTVPPSAMRIVQALRESPEVRVRTAEKRRFRQEVRTILDLYNDAWSDNWGFVPVTEAEAEKLARDVRLIADTKIVPFVEINGEPAGVALGLPNLNEAIHDLNGHLFPFGFLKLLWRLKVRRLKTGRLLLLGVKKEYRTRRYAGLAYLICDELYRRAREQGYKWVEFSWTLEDNHLVNAMITKVGCQHYKTYRVYEKELAP